MKTIVDTFPLDRYPAYKEMPYPHATDRILAFIAEEVRRQQDTPWHCFRMHQAWQYALELRDLPIAMDDILVIGRLVDEANEDGFRMHGVSVGNRNGADWHLVSGQIAELIRNQETLDPQEFYWRFEMIHPFGDGNGRSGKILFNWLNDSLHNPVWPEPHPSWGSILNP